MGVGFFLDSLSAKTDLDPGIVEFVQLKQTFCHIKSSETLFIFRNPEKSLYFHLLLKDI